MDSRRRGRHALATALGAIGLAGMAYCHIADVGTKFDEGVHYMAALFCCNIAAALGLAAAVVAFGAGGGRRARLVWTAAAALALATIAGFVWSRTVGLPQMEDHVGEWDALGIASLGFESAVVAASAWCLAPRARPVTAVCDAGG